MKKLSDTLTEQGIAFDTLEIKNAFGDMTYFEDRYGYWCRWEYDSNDKLTYSEDSKGVKRGTARSSNTNQQPSRAHTHTL